MQTVTYAILSLTLIPITRALVVAYKIKKEENQ